MAIFFSAFCKQETYSEGHTSLTNKARRDPRAKVAKVLDQEGEVLFVFHLTRAVSCKVSTTSLACATEMPPRSKLLRKLNETGT